MENVKLYRGEGLDGHSFDHITLDTMVLHGLKNRGIRGESDAIVFFDFATHWLDAVPVKNRTNAETLNAFRPVIGEMSPVNTFSLDMDCEHAPPAVREVYCEKAREFVSTCRNVGIKVEHSTPGMPRTNAISESKVKLVLQGTRAALRQAGLEAWYWPYACRHFYFAKKIAMEEGSSAYLKRFGGDRFSGHVLPFGCLVDYFPTAILVLNGHERWLIVMVCLEMVKSMPLRARMSSDAMIFRIMRSCLMIPKATIRLGSRLPIVRLEMMVMVLMMMNQTRSLISPLPAPAELPLMKRGASKFSATSKPGKIILEYHHEMGSKWNGHYLVADLEDFKQNVKATKCSSSEASVLRSERESYLSDSDNLR